MSLQLRFTHSTPGHHAQFQWFYQSPMGPKTNNKVIPTPAQSGTRSLLLTTHLARADRNPSTGPLSSFPMAPTFLQCHLFTGICLKPFIFTQYNIGLEWIASPPPPNKYLIRGGRTGYPPSLLFWNSSTIVAFTLAHSLHSPCLTLHNFLPSHLIICQSHTVRDHTQSRVFPAPFTLYLSLALSLLRQAREHVKSRVSVSSQELFRCSLYPEERGERKGME